MSTLANTGGFTGPAPEIATTQTQVSEATDYVPAVPLSTVTS